MWGAATQPQGEQQQRRPRPLIPGPSVGTGPGLRSLARPSSSSGSCERAEARAERARARDCCPRRCRPLLLQQRRKQRRRQPGPIHNPEEPSTSFEPSPGPGLGSLMIQQLFCIMREPRPGPCEGSKDGSGQPPPLIQPLLLQHQGKQHRSRPGPAPTLATPPQGEGGKLWRLRSTERERERRERGGEREREGEGWVAGGELICCSWQKAVRECLHGRVRLCGWPCCCLLPAARRPPPPHVHATHVARALPAALDPIGKSEHAYNDRMFIT
eukprot:jgi/Mesen1/2505/ME000159S01619